MSYNALVRPPCGSVLLQEHYVYDQHFDKKMDEWDDWAEGREVQPWGYCSEHKNKRTK